jgi:hypothetical protein
MGTVTGLSRGGSLAVTTVTLPFDEVNGSTKRVPSEVVPRFWNLMVSVTIGLPPDPTEITLLAKNTSKGWKSCEEDCSITARAVTADWLVTLF